MHHHPQQKSPAMISGFLKSSFRSLSRSLSYTVINISGLALGITCAILIFSIVAYHLQFDKFHKEGDRIYRFVTEQHRDKISHAAAVPPAFGKVFRDDYTFGEVMARVCIADAVVISFEHNGTTQRFSEELVFADPTYLEIFNFPLVAGVNELNMPGTAIITERIAKKWFGDDSAVGKVVRFDNQLDLRITGVLKDLPVKTDFPYEILISYTDVSTYSDWIAEEDAWGGITSQVLTFTRLREGVDPAEVEKVLPELVNKYRKGTTNRHVYKLQPLADVHFNPDYNGRVSATTLAVLAVIGFFLVLTACLNFINLATAQSLTRSREVGIRKALGSARRQLFWQFTTETFVLVLISFVISFCVAYAVVPLMNTLLDTHITIELLDYRLLLFSFLLIVIVTFMSGAYPGMLLSGFKPVQALKGEVVRSQSGGLNIRRLLITAQFTISQVLLIGLIVVLTQINYFKSADLGFDKDGVVMIPLGSRDEKAKTLKQQFLSLPNVQSVSMCFSAPASWSNWGTTIKFNHSPEPEEFSSRFKGADADFVETFRLDLIAGRNIIPTDTVKEMLVNETMVERLGETPESILGKVIRFNEQFDGEIVGVVADFSDGSLHDEINPVFIATQLDFLHVYGVKINMNNVSETLAALEKAWSAMYPDQIFTSEFLDEETARFYRTEETMLSVVEIFSVIALVIGCLGLYGLASFMAARKQKEIGIRKALGGSVSHILWLFGREFSKLVLMAFLVAAPLGWFLMSKWLSNFAYKIDLGAWIFGVNLIIVLVVVVATVGFQSGRAAMMSPVKSLRSE